MADLKWTIKNGISKGVSKGISTAVSKAVSKAMEPTATKIANKAASKLDKASGQAIDAAEQGATDYNTAMANLERAAQNYATEASKNMKICPNCEYVATASEKFCPKCGSQLPEQTLAQSAVCPQCGTQNQVGTKFCAACGTKLPIALQEEQMLLNKQNAVLAEWDSLLPQFPRWNGGGTNWVLENEDLYVWFSATFPDYTTALSAVEQYLALLRAEGFASGGQYPSEKTLYKKIGEVCYKVDAENSFEGSSECPTIYFGTGEPVGGLDYIAPTSGKKSGLKGLFR